MKKYELRPTNQFKKDLRLAKKRGYKLNNWKRNIFDPLTNRDAQ